MTCREKLILEHPDYISVKHIGGCYGCPDLFGYLPRPDCCQDKCRPCESNCTNCWDREIPEKIEERYKTYEKSANEIKAVHIAFMNAGFSDEPVFELVKIMIKMGGIIA